MPPPVLPAQAPTNISITRISLERVGQKVKITAGKAGGRDDGTTLEGRMAQRLAEAVVHML